tara:strand:- start:1378 stop:1575 length:198 start_codon:yes stop_codon:yes gene_type:complete
MDRLNEMALGFCAVIGGFLGKAIWKRQEKLGDRLSDLEKLIVTKQDLEPIERNVDMILNHIINKK